MPREELAAKANLFNMGIFVGALTFNSIVILALYVSQFPLVKFKDQT